jgi:sulfur-carrier protein adenylyltransferase/sulfurtransferase
MTASFSNERYHRQLILKEFGEAGQQKLLEAKVLMIGAGGLGCAALPYLAAAGVGTLGIADDDRVALSNLHRQTLYSTNDVGALKAIKAKEVLEQLNPEISIMAYPQRVTTDYALHLIKDFDIIIDGTDNFASRYLINDACVLMNKPLVYGAVSQWEGQVAIFNDTRYSEPPVNYRDLFPQPPKDNEILNCAEAGVLGVLPGIIGAFQANETIKWLTGIGQSLVNRLLTYNALNNQSYEIALTAQSGTRLLIPSNETAFKKADYQWLCSSAPDELEINGSDFNALIDNTDSTFIDIREWHEQPSVDEFKHIKIPLSEFNLELADIKTEHVIVFCQTGKRSLGLARQLADKYKSTKKIFSLAGGISQWKQNQKKEAL